MESFVYGMMDRGWYSAMRGWFGAVIRGNCAVERLIGAMYDCFGAVVTLISAVRHKNSAVERHFCVIHMLLHS